MDTKGFFQPQTLSKVKSLLIRYEGAKILSGGTDLLLDIRKGEHIPPYIIDISRLKELKFIQDTKDHIYLGSRVTFTDLLKSDVITKHLPVLVDCAKSMGSPQIRNMATIGGNIINCAAAADIIPCIIGLHGRLVFESIGKERIVLCEDYFTNYSIEKIKRDEILTKVIVSKKYSKSGFYKLGKRNSLAISRISASVCLNVENDLINDLTVCLGAVGKYPFRVYSLEQIALNQPLEYLYSKETLQILEDVVSESIKGRATLPFKKEGIKGVYKQAVNRAIGGNV